MSANLNPCVAFVDSAKFGGVSDEIVEMSLLLPSWQMAALETAAHDQGLTTGAMVRQLIRDFFTASQRCRSPYQAIQSLS